MINKYCSNCGESMNEYAIVCSNCGRPAADSNKQEENVRAEQVVYETPRNISAQLKNPFLAMVFSLFAGLGQVYNGKFWRGIFFMLTTFVGLVLIIPGLIFWVWAMYDAYTESEAMNNGEKPYKEATVWEIIIFLISPIIIALLMGFVTFFIRFMIIPLW